MLLGSTRHGGAAWSIEPLPCCWATVEIFTLGDTKSPAQAEPGSRVLMQGAEQQKAETTTLERELLGPHRTYLPGLYNHNQH